MQPPINLLTQGRKGANPQGPGKRSFASRRLGAFALNSLLVAAGRAVLSAVKSSSPEKILHIPKKDGNTSLDET
jgi:hypothetical protein